MANQTLEDVFDFLEAKLATVPDLRDKVRVCKPNEPYPGIIRDYGVRIYLGLEKPKETIYRKIGPIANEIWRINVDFLFNKNLKSRQLYSDAKGLSYWIDLMTSTLKHQNNNGAFKTSWWEFDRQEIENDAVILRGIFTCEVQNVY